MFSGTNSGWGVFAWPPTAEVRVEAGANLTATTSFCLIEIPRYGEAPSVPSFTLLEIAAGR